MLQIEHSGYPQELTESIHDGVLVRASDPTDLARLLALIAENKDAAIQVTRSSGETDDQAQLRTFTARLLSGVGLGTVPAPSLPSEFIPTLVRRSHGAAGLDSMESLAVALAAALEAWIPSSETPPGNAADLSRDPTLLEALLLLPLPGGEREAVLRFSRPRGILEIRPGSILTSLGVITTLRASCWALGLAARVRTLAGPSARAGARSFVDRIRMRANSTRDLLRLDRLDPDECIRLRRPQILVVLVHGLFATDRGAFDNLLSRLERRAPVDLFKKLLADGDGTVEGVPQRRPLCELLSSLRRGFDAVAADQAAVSLLKGSQHPRQHETALEQLKSLVALRPGPLRSTAEVSILARRRPGIPSRP